MPREALAPGGDEPTLPRSSLHTAPGSVRLCQGLRKEVRTIESSTLCFHLLFCRSRFGLS
jgi:hypothetical protein